MQPPKKAIAFLRWFCHQDHIEEIEGDLTEVFIKDSARSRRYARWKFAWNVVKYLRPEFIKPLRQFYQHNFFGMYQNYLKVGWRSLRKNKGHSYINMMGLTAGLAAMLLIGMWVFDELSFNKYYKNYDRIAQVCQHQMVYDEIHTTMSVPVPLGMELRNSFKHDFRHVVRMWWELSHTLSIEEKKFPRTGVFMDPGGLEMFSFDMVKGSRRSLDDPSSIIISESTAQALFGDQDPLNQVVKIDNFIDAKVTGVFREMPANSRFHALQFVSSWDFWVSSNSWMKENENNWYSAIMIFAEIEPNNTFESISKKIENVKFDHLPREQALRDNPKLFLNPMSRWHLYSQWKDGKESGGRIQFVWLFGIIGVFVLALACINFMNLSTAQSEARAKEVGIRKSIGSARAQLVSQFFTETVLLVLFAFVLAVCVTWTVLPWFNQLAEKEMTMPWNNTLLMVCTLALVILTGVLAGSYPALFLSSFEPVKVLKGTFRAGRFANLPRKILVVIQFTVSIALIIGTITVWRQIQFAKNRPIGYSREGLIAVRKNSPDFWGKTEVLQNRLKESGAIVELAESSSPATETWFIDSNFNWAGKDPDSKIDFACTAVTYDYGKTLGWNFLRGRDYEHERATDSSAIVINQAAARTIGWKDPIDEEIIWNGKRFKVIGVIQDMIVDSPYEPVKQCIYFQQSNFFQNLFGDVCINIRLNPNLSAHEAIERTEKVFESVVPTVPFEYSFTDQEYAKKFAGEERIGKLATLFASLAIFISCLGLFGLASFVAQQRTKELSIRKVMGASAFNLWKLLSKDFVFLVIISIFIAIPVAYYFLSDWLETFQYRTTLGWWIFVVAGMSAISITLVTVSYQTVKAATENPIKSLRSGN